MAIVSCPLRHGRRVGAADVLSLASVVFALAAGVLILTLGGFSLTDDGVPLLLLPPAVMATPILARGTPVARSLRIGAAVLMTAFSLLVAASVGLFYAPAALIAIIAAAVADA